MENGNCLATPCIIRDSERFQRAVFRGNAAGVENVVDELHMAIDVSGREVLDANGEATGDNDYRLYLDCRKRKIFAKHLTFIFLRPIHTCVKFLFHATVVGPIMCNVDDFNRGNRIADLHAKKEKGLELTNNEERFLKRYGESELITKEECVKRIIYSVCLDSVRTVFYGTALTISHLFAVITAPFVSSTFFYRTRNWTGDLDRSLLRVEDYVKWTDPLESRIWNIMPCFSPIAMITQPAVFNANKDEKHFFLSNEKLTPGQGIHKMVMGIAKFRRTERAPFNDCCCLLGKDQPYVSAAASSPAM